MPEDAPKPGTFPKERGKPKILLALSLATLILISTLVIGTFNAFDFITTPPEKGIAIDVTGFQWAWRFKHPNGVQTVGELVIPVNETIIFHITSTDVKHKFGISEFKTGADAIPGEHNTIWIKATSTGEYTIRCYELCGVGHALMLAKMRVVTQSEYKQQLANITRGE